MVILISSISMFAIFNFENDMEIPAIFLVFSVFVAESGVMGITFQD